MSRFQLVFLVFVSSIALSACEENKFMAPSDDVNLGTDNTADVSITNPDLGQGVDTTTAADANQIDSSTNIDSNQGADLATQLDSNLQADVAQQADSGSPDIAQQADTAQGTDAAMVGTDAESNSPDVLSTADVNSAPDLQVSPDVQVSNDVAKDVKVMCPGEFFENGTWLFVDKDDDGFGTTLASTVSFGCESKSGKGTGLAVNKGDCDDNNAAIHPGATEVCFNNLDDNCNGATDENCQPQATYCMDYDNDTYVVADGVCVLSSNQKFGDCDNFNASVNPGEKEVCGDNIDNNCDGQTDEGCSTCKDGTSVPNSAMVKWFKDLDGDTYAGTTTDGQLHCPQDWKPGTGWYTESLDCDDGNPMIHPGAFTFTHPNGTYEEEFCNGKDDNCDGQTDEGFNIGQACIGNAGVCQVAGKIECGGMGFGVGVGVPDPTSMISICSVNPFQSMSQAVTEICGDSLDNDCDGVTDNGCVKNDSVECKLLGGVNGSDGFCKTFCDTCKAFQTCLDVNLDGIADTCQDPPTAGGYFPEEGLIALRFKNMGYVPSNIVGTVHYYKSLSDYTNLSGWDPVDFGAFFDALNFYALTELGQKFNDPNKVPDVCGMQFNATIFKSGVATDWLCEGSGTLSHVIDSAQILYLHHDVLIDITKRVTVWKDPNQNGCNVTIPVAETCPLQTPKP